MGITWLKAKNNQQEIRAREKDEKSNQLRGRKLSA
jgi:hypothetical protein